MKKTLSMIFTLCFICMMNITSFATSTHPVRLVDNANILQASEKTTLTNRLNEISQRQNVDVVVVTVNSIGSKDMHTFATDFYVNNHYGMGSNDDGVLLLINMKDRKFQIVAHGYGSVAFTNAGMDYVIDQLGTKFKKKNYSGAINDFATLSDNFISKAKSGAAYDKHNLPKKAFDFGKNILISLGAGAAVAAIVLFILYKQMKNVAMKATADDYLKKDSLKVTQSRDVYLYTHTDRRAKPKNNGDKSSMRSSSSGRSFRSGGGSF